MDTEELIKQAKRIKSLKGQVSISELQIEAGEFLKNYGGKDNEFYKTLTIQYSAWDQIEDNIIAALESFIRYVENGLLRSISLEREIQIETVSDYLEQAERLLNDRKIHPAAPAVLIGASLEEFLRTWLEEEKFDLTTIKNSLDTYAQELKKLGLIKKQDFKDITSWGGIRNDAAHGHFEEVNDTKRIKIMLEGVNLFIRKNSIE